MSRKIWGIALTVSAAAVIALLVFWYTGRKSAVPPEEQSGTKLVEAAPEETKEADVSKEEEASVMDVEHASSMEETDGYEFVLMNHNNYVAVYKLPDLEIYEYTDVILDVLPPDLEEEIRQGKYLRSEEELYNFLENYTS